MIFRLGYKHSKFTLCRLNSLGCFCFHDKANTILDLCENGGKGEEFGCHVSNGATAIENLNCVFQSGFQVARFFCYSELRVFSIFGFVIILPRAPVPMLKNE